MEVGVISFTQTFRDVYLNRFPSNFTSTWELPSEESSEIAGLFVKKQKNNYFWKIS